MQAATLSRRCAWGGWPSIAGTGAGGLGAALLVNALRRAARSEIPAVALTVDANDEGAAAFYGHFGFQSLTHDPLALFLPLATVK